MLAVVLVLVLCCKAIAVPLADFYQFGSDVGDMELPRDDDNSSSPIELLHPLLSLEPPTMLHLSVTLPTSTYIQCYHHCTLPI